jgi:hypothetical protein
MKKKAVFKFQKWQVARENIPISKREGRPWNRPFFKIQKRQVARENIPISEKGGHPWK